MESEVKVLGRDSYVNQFGWIIYKVFMEADGEQYVSRMVIFNPDPDVVAELPFVFELI